MSILGALAWLFYVLLLYTGTALVAQFAHAQQGFPWWVAYLFAVNLVTYLIFLLDWLIAPLANVPVLGWILLRAPNWLLFGLLPAIGGFPATLLSVGSLNHKSSDAYSRMRNWSFGIALMAALLLFLLHRSAGLTLDGINTLVENYVVDTTQAVQAVATRLGAGSLLRGPGTTAS